MRRFRCRRRGTNLKYFASFGLPIDRFANMVYNIGRLREGEKTMKITVKVGRGYKLEAEARVFEPKNWLYLNFAKGYVAIDRATGEIVKKHCAPVFCPGEIERLLKEVE